MIKHDVVLFYLADSIGDKFCHDVLNNKKCNFDGNDCCARHNGNERCRYCKCDRNIRNLTTNFENEQTSSTTTISYNTTKIYKISSTQASLSNDNVMQDEHYHTCSEPFWYNDMICDDDNNYQDCGYDGGDCCNQGSSFDFCNDCTCKRIPMRHKIDCNNTTLKFEDI